MKSVFGYASALLALASPLASAVPLAARQENQEQFVLRAITSRGIEPPINLSLNVVDHYVFANADPSVPGFQSRIRDDPRRGKAVSDEIDGLLQLRPNEEIEGVYDFRVAAVPNSEPDIIYENWFATGAGCGSHCGGPQLVYDEDPSDEAFGGSWLARESGDGEYSIHWYRGDGPVPEGFTSIYLMRTVVEEDA